MRFYFYFQLLQIRQSLQASFEGCDIYTPRKPKGLASKALEEWRKHYPNSEETNKTIGKHAKIYCPNVCSLTSYNLGPKKQDVGQKTTYSKEIMVLLCEFNW